MSSSSKVLVCFANTLIFGYKVYAIWQIQVVDGYSYSAVRDYCEILLIRIITRITNQFIYRKVSVGPVKSTQQYSRYMLLMWYSIV